MLGNVGQQSVVIVVAEVLNLALAFLIRRRVVVLVEDRVVALRKSRDHQDQVLLVREVFLGLLDAAGLVDAAQVLLILAH